MGRDFYERFDLHIDPDEARQRFVNRALNEIFDAFIDRSASNDAFDVVRRSVASKLGSKDQQRSISSPIEDDFHKCLRAIEVVYAVLPGLHSEPRRLKAELTAIVLDLLEQSEVDLGISWDNGKFRRTGAKLMDDRLINDPLRWLREKKYDSVVQPFEKSLGHFLESEKRPELLADVITDAYEALEAMAKILTGRNDDLSSTQEQFLKALGLGKEYRRVLGLKEYVAFGSIYRHGANKDAPKPKPTPREVESFLYQTGIYLRLATFRDVDK